jgi:hypothetical protein
MKRLMILALCCTTFACISYGQNPMECVYDYDASGNRIVHRVITFRNQLLQTNSTEEDSSDTTAFPYYTEQMGALQLNVYPNPTLGQVNVQVLNAVEAVSGSIRLYTLSGQLLRTQPIDALSCTIDLSTYPSGTYLVKVLLNQVTQEWKIIKE